MKISNVKFALVALAVSLCSTVAGATTITASGSDSQWNVNDPSCNSSSNTCVIGPPSLFGIKSASVTVSNTGAVSADIQMNFENATLSPYVDSGITLSAADIIIDGGQYAIVLDAHSGLVTAGLYQLTGDETAQTVLGNPPGATYRNNLPVWASPSGAVLLGTGTETITALGNGTTAPEYNIAITGITGGAALYNGDLSFEAASATCGNGVVFGSVPEPAAMGLMGFGLLGLGLVGRRRFTRRE